MMEEEIELGEALPIPGSLESSDNEVVTNFDILKIIFSRKTAPHAFSLSIFLILLGFFSQSSNQLFINLNTSIMFLYIY